MGISAFDPSVISQAAVESRQIQTQQQPAQQTQPAPQSNEALQTPSEQPSTQTQSVSSNERVGGQIDTFA